MPWLLVAIGALVLFVMDTKKEDVKPIPSNPTPETKVEDQPTTKEEKTNEGNA